MKKILPALILFTLVLSLVLPVVVLAQVSPPTTCKLVQNLTAIDKACTKGASVSIEQLGACCAVNAIYRITDFIFIVLVAIAILFFLLGAYTLITAAGAPENVARGRNYILYAIVGLAFALLARAVPAIAKLLIGA